MENKKTVVQPNELSKEMKVSMRTRIISALVAAAIVFPSLILGDWFIVALIAFVAVIASYEIVHCMQKKFSILLYIFTCIFSLLLSFWPFILNLVSSTADFTNLFNSVSNLSLSVGLVFIGILILFFLVVIDKQFDVKDACFLCTMVILVSLGLQSALFLRFYPQYEHYLVNPVVDGFNFFDNFASCSLFVYVVIATFMTDIGAYFVGVFFGKHKMNPRISPKKTWEGFFGGVFFSLVCSFAFALILALTGHPILPLFDASHWYNYLILSFILPFVATLGDFVFSSVKRYYGIKDYGNIMPGHGGALDRLDSLIFSFVTTALFITLISFWMGIF